MLHGPAAKPSFIFPQLFTKERLAQCRLVDTGDEYALALLVVLVLLSAWLPTRVPTIELLRTDGGRLYVLCCCWLSNSEAYFLLSRGSRILVKTTSGTETLRDKETKNTQLLPSKIPPLSK